MIRIAECCLTGLSCRDIFTPRGGRRGAAAKKDQGQRMETVLQLAECLFVPYRKRLSQAYVVNDQGARELRIYYGIKEIVFDEERYCAFGEQLVTEPSFTGQHATTWGPG